MVFKFIKELIDAAKEGVAEGKKELAEEKAAKQAQDEMAADELNHKLTAISDKEKFFTALGAPYRRLFVSEEVLYLSSHNVPEAKKKELAEFLERDFGVHDRDSLLKMTIEAQASVFSILCLNVQQVNGQANDQANTERFLESAANFAQNADAARYGEWVIFRHELEAIISQNAANHDALSRARIALWMARFSYVSMASAGLGYVDLEEAQGLIAPLAQLGVQQIHSWHDYAALFKAGEKDDGTNNFLGRKIMSSMVDGLLNKDDSVWKTIAWPQAI
jgi:Protein of unknown function (DUF1266)